jgi:Transposase C of IS166 homeodomain
MTLEEQAAILRPADIVALLAENARLKQQLEWFQRQLFGRKSEKGLREPDPEQLSLAGMLTASVPPADQPPLHRLVRPHKPHRPPLVGSPAIVAVQRTLALDEPA